jgi:hypothetical protein
MIDHILLEIHTEIFGSGPSEDAGCARLPAHGSVGLGR